MRRFLCFLMVLVCVPPAWGTYCYNTSYSFPSTPHCSTCTTPTTYPVSQYLAFPVPIFGSVYVGPAGATNVTATGATITAPTAPASLAPSAPVGATAPSVASSDLQELLKLNRQVVVQLSKLTDSQTAIAADLATLKARVESLERAAGAVPPTPPDPAPIRKGSASAPADPGPLPEVWSVYKASCFACHQKGKEMASKSSTYPSGLAMFGADGKTRLFLTPDQIRGLVDHVTAGTMPPAKNKVGAVLLTGETATAILRDAKNYPNKKE